MTCQFSHHHYRRHQHLSHTHDDCVRRIFYIDHFKKLKREDVIEDHESVEFDILNKLILLFSELMMRVCIRLKNFVMPFLYACEWY